MYPTCYLRISKRLIRPSLNLENMACLLIERRVPVQIARGQMNLDVDCSILVDRKAGWLRAGVHHRPLSRSVVADTVVPVDMPALQPVGPDDVRVHGRQRRFYVAGIETVVQPLEKFSVAGHIKSEEIYTRARRCRKAVAIIA